MLMSDLCTWHDVKLTLDMRRLNQLLGMILTSSKTSATTTAAVSYFREEY